MDKIQLRALGKINLGLDVLGKLENGYHEVRMIMQTVYLYDQIVITRKKEPGISLTTNLYFLPTGEKNLAYRAAKLLMDEYKIRDGVEIELKKHIPVSAGMAGGSSDAAAVLFGLNRMFHLGLSTEALMERGVTLGADVPYCILRGTVLAEGIGEKLTPLPAMPPCVVLLAKPPVSVSTRQVYEKFDAVKEVHHPDIDGIMEGIEEGSLEKIAGCIGNALEEVTMPMYPVIENIRQMMVSGGALGALMSGSGPTVFGLYLDRELARQTADKIRSSGLARQVYVTSVHSARRES